LTLIIVKFSKNGGF